MYIYLITVQWDLKKNSTLIHSLHTTKVVSIVLSSDDNILYSLGADLNLIGYNLVNKTKLFETKLKAGEAQILQSSRTNPEVVYALCNNGIYMINNGKVVAEHETSFEARSFAVSETEYYVGDRVSIF